MVRKAYKFNYKLEEDVMNIYKLDMFEINNIFEFINTDKIQGKDIVVVDGRGLDDKYMKCMLLPNTVYAMQILTVAPRSNLILDVDGKKINLGTRSTPEKWGCGRPISHMKGHYKWRTLIFSVHEKDLYLHEDFSNGSATKSRKVMEDVLFKEIKIGVNSDFVALNPTAYSLMDEYNEYIGTIVRLHRNFFNKVEKRNYHNNNNAIKAPGVVYTGSFNNITIDTTIPHMCNVNAFNDIFIKGQKACPEAVMQPYFLGETTIGINKHNTIHVETSKWSSIQIYANNSNVILTDNINEYCVFDSNNFIHDVDLEYKGSVELLPYRPVLSIKKKITEEITQEQDYIVVDNVEYVLAGHNVYFTTSDKAFVKRKVIGVEDNKIIVDRPIECNVFKDGFLYSHPPVEYDEFRTKTSKKTSIYKRRIYVEEVSDKLFLRDIIVGDFKSIVNYADEISSLIITNDITQAEIPEGTDVVCPEYKFIKPKTFVYGQDNIPNIYIGQKVYAGLNEYVVTGFNLKDNTMTFNNDDTINLKGIELTTEEIPLEYVEGERHINSVTPIKYKLYDKYLKVSKKDVELDISKYKYVFIKGKLKDIVNYTSDAKFYYIELNNTPVPIVINNSIVKGNYVAQKYNNTDEIDSNFNSYETIHDSKDL